MHRRGKTLISVIISTYNYGHYIDTLIKQIQSQTYANFEVIIVDDGSTDQTPEMLRNLTTKDDRFKIIRIDNSGQGIARVVGFEHTKGDYITFADSDDAVAIDWLETLHRDLIHSQSDIVNLGVQEFTKTPPVSVRTDHGKIRVLSQKDAYIAWLIDKELKGFLCNKGFRRELLEKVFTPLNFNYLEDSYTVLKALNKTLTVCDDSKVCYFYRIHRDSSVWSKYRESDKEAVKAIEEEIKTHVVKQYPELKPLCGLRMAKLDIFLMERMTFNDLCKNEQMLTDLRQRISHAKEYKKRYFNIVDILLIDGFYNLKLTFLLLRFRGVLVKVQRHLRMLKQVHK